MTLDDTMFRTPMAINPRAVVFDLDDTLYPERQYILSGFRAVDDYFRRLYRKSVYDDLLSIYESGERNNVFGSALARHFQGVEDAVLKKTLHVFWSHTPRIELFEDARICLAILFARSVRVGVITTGRGTIQQKKIAALELDPLLDGIIYTDDLLGEVEPGQPAEDAFHILALQLDVELGEMCYVGDNPLTDFSTPRRLGISTVRIKRPGGEHSAATPPALGYQSDRVITSMVDLPPLLFSRSNAPHR